MGSLGEVCRRELFPKPSDPIMIELNRLANQLRDKERKLGAACSEIKTLKVTELLKDKAIMELSSQLKELYEKLRISEKHTEHKNLEVKKLVREKKEALAAQFAVEATLRRVQATSKDEEFVSVDALIAPLESDLKMYKNEIATLKEDKKALERLMKSKEAALVEGEKTMHGALERALIVENVQNQNLELKRQIEIYQEQNRLLEKANRRKVVEVEKLTQTIRELEESILAGGAAANVVHDYRRQLSELNEVKRTLERELARLKVSANRAATAVSNEWKDGSDHKVMPVKVWLEERRFLQGEIQRLRGKVAVSERSTKAEAQLKDKLKLRLKTLEEGLKDVSSLSIKQDENSDRPFGSNPNVVAKKRSSSQPRASRSTNKISVLQQPNLASGVIDSGRIIKRTNSLNAKFITGENLARKNLRTPRSKLFDETGKENARSKINPNELEDDNVLERTEISEEVESNRHHDVESRKMGHAEDGSEDIVSGFLYDRLQKEVINLRKLCEEKDGLLNAKDDQIKPLLKKVETLTKAMEVESTKMRREMAVRGKEASVKSEENKQNSKITSIPKRAVKHHGAPTNSRTK